jgi:DNA-binding response OmpR family regulator
MRILLIEDEAEVARTLDRGLSAHGHQVLIAESGEDGLLFVRTEQVDLVLLDIMLPGQSGIQTLTELRQLRTDLPIIMLTARDEIESKIGALDIGADDYITKPFSFDELLARIRALTRRFDQQQSSSIQFGDLHIDLLAHRVRRGDRQIDLSRREYALLEYFARNPGRLLSRQQILAAVWQYDYEGESNVVDVYVGYLRTKLDVPGKASLFATVRGSGYRFEPPQPQV